MEQVINKKKFISIPELAKKLGISRIAVYKRVKEGKIHAVKIGRNFAIESDQVVSTEERFKQKDYISLPKLARQLGISRISLYKQAKEGQVKAITVGRNFVFNKEYAQGLVKQAQGPELTTDEKLRMKTTIKKAIKHYTQLLEKLEKS